jgi:Tfp pilus assembly protein PilN
VTRTNYLLTWTERHAGIALPAFAPALRRPLGVLACAVALVAVAWAIQHARLVTLEARGAEYAERLATAGIALARVRAVETDLARLRALHERIGTIRRSGPLRAGEIAALGDRLPDGAWLTSLRADRTALALEGRGARIETVAAAVANLTRLPAYGGARLLSVRDDPAGHGVSYALALDPRR